MCESGGLVQANIFESVATNDAKWLFSWKTDEQGWIVKPKSRPVTRGSKPACELNLDLCHFDVDQAFVQYKLDESIYLRLPSEAMR